MALRRRGKDKFYHAYFRTLRAQPDGTLRYAMTTVNLGTGDLVTARAMEADLMARAKAARIRCRVEAHMRHLEEAAGAVPEFPVPPSPVRVQRRKRLKLSDWAVTVAKYRDIGEASRLVFSRFVRLVPEKYFDEVTPESAFSYLNRQYGGPGKGKSFNNTKTSLNVIFNLLRIDAGIEESPFAKIPNRRHESRHQRPFTEDEFRRIYAAAREPWKTAVLIAWWTGLREESVFNLRWSAIAGDVLTTMPGKTARFGRAVQIPIHPQLQAALDALPRKNDYVLGCYKITKGGAFHHQFRALLDSLHIVTDKSGIVNFNSIRDSFVTRCDEAGLPRHATRGLVGHVSDRETDLYSHDLSSARQIQNLPSVKLGN